MTYHPAVKRIIKDPIALAILLTVPAILFLYDTEEAYDYYYEEFRTIGWRMRSLWEATDTQEARYNHAALAIIWAVAIIRWKWQKEDRAKQG